MSQGGKHLFEFICHKKGQVVYSVMAVITLYRRSMINSVLPDWNQKDIN